jgi:mono/diheme cytochrome c family protein
MMVLGNSSRLVVILSSVGCGLVLLGAAADPALLSAQAQATAPSPEDVTAGLRIFRQKGDCQACHGWAGDGRKMDSQMPDGANLRTTKLNRDKLVMAVKCGVPGKGMPAFDRLAYSDGRCYGMPDPATTLQNREVEQVVDMILTKMTGQGPMDRAKCIEFWGSDTPTCAEFPK